MEPKSKQKLRLDQFLKLKGIVPTGGQAKLRIQNGEVRVNGAVETCRGRGLHAGDEISIDGRTLVVAAELFADGNRDGSRPAAGY